MLTTVEKLIALKSVDFFDRTSDQVLAELATILIEVEVPAGSDVFAKDDMGYSMYIIVDGRVRVHDGDREIATLAEGNFFGEMALLDTVDRSASVTAVEDTRLLQMDQEPFYVLLEDHSEVGRRIMQLLTGRLRRLMDERTGNERLNNERLNNERLNNERGN
jgi:CRP/FNR family cyclic AMP-dependent transcriptional regulator